MALRSCDDRIGVFLRIRTATKIDELLLLEICEADDAHTAATFAVVDPVDGDTEWSGLNAMDDSPVGMPRNSGYQISISSAR